MVSSQEVCDRIRAVAGVGGRYSLKPEGPWVSSGQESGRESAKNRGRNGIEGRQERVGLNPDENSDFCPLQGSILAPWWQV